MVTKEQAQEHTHFHEEGCTLTRGPRGGVKTSVRFWRANGACKTWKTQPNRFCVPIKRGLKDFGYLTQDNMQHFHTESECPVFEELKETYPILNAMAELYS